MSDPASDPGPSPGDPALLRAYLKGGPANGKVVDLPAAAEWVDVPLASRSGDRPPEHHPARYARSAETLLGAQVFVHVEPAGAQRGIR